MYEAQHADNLLGVPGLAPRSRRQPLPSPPVASGAHRAPWPAAPAGPGYRSHWGHRCSHPEPSPSGTAG